MDFSYLTGETPESSSPVSFREAWSSVMLNTKTRAWLFNHNPPTALELLRSRENSPLLKTAILDPPGKVYAGPMYRERLDEMFCTCQRLRDGTQLGFAINSKCVDITAMGFAPFHPSFRDPRLIVNRLVVSAIRNRLFALEFLWHFSGVLTVRFINYNSLSDATRMDIRSSYSVHAFVPSDTAILSAVALCPGQPNADFIEGKFENYLVSDDWYVAEMTDALFQSSCVFCATRGRAVCDCPLPMRRRHASDSCKAVGYRMKRGKSVWQEFATIVNHVSSKGRFVCNLYKAPRTRYARIMVSGYMPYETECTVNIVTHATLQFHLNLTGASPESVITVLTPFSSNDNRRKRLLTSLIHVGENENRNSFTQLEAAEQSNENNTWNPQLEAREQNNNLNPQLEGAREWNANSSITSSDLDVISVIKGVQKRPRMEQNSYVDEWVNWNDEKEPGFEAGVDAVIETAVVDTSIVEVFTAKNNESHASQGQDQTIPIMRNAESGSSRGVGAQTLSTAKSAKSGNKKTGEQRTVSTAKSAKSGNEKTSEQRTVSTVKSVNSQNKSGGERTVSTVKSTTVVCKDGVEQSSREAVRVFECPECGIQIRNKLSNLKRHIQVVHKKERKFECQVPECGQRFQTKTNLKRHTASVHKHLNRPKPASAVLTPDTST